MMLPSIFPEASALNYVVASTQYNVSALAQAADIISEAIEKVRGNFLFIIFIIKVIFFLNENNRKSNILIARFKKKAIFAVFVFNHILLIFRIFLTQIASLYGHKKVL